MIAPLRVHAGVGVEADVQQAIEATTIVFGRLDCLFNNAGLALPPWSIEERHFGRVSAPTLTVPRKPLTLGRSWTEITAGFEKLAAVMSAAAARERQ